MFPHKCDIISDYYVSQQGPVKMRHSYRKVLTAVPSQSSSSSPIRCTSIYLCGGTSLRVDPVGWETQGSEQEVRAVHQRLQTTPPLLHPPRQPPPPHSSPPPTAWSERRLGERPTPCCTAVARCWLRSFLDMTLGRLWKTQSLGRIVIRHAKRRRRRRRRVCFSVQPGSAAVPHHLAVAPARTKHHQTTIVPASLSISSPCQPFWNATPLSVSCSLRLRCQCPPPERLSLWQWVTKSQSEQDQQQLQRSRAPGQQLTHRQQCKPKASRQNRPITTQGRVCVERSTTTTTTVSKFSLVLLLIIILIDILVIWCMSENGENPF